MKDSKTTDNKEITIEAENTYGLEANSPVVWAGKIFGRVSSTEVLEKDGRSTAILHVSMRRTSNDPIFDRVGKETPLIVKVNPSSAFNMEDFFNAGGIPRTLR